MTLFSYKTLKLGLGLFLLLLVGLSLFVYQKVTQGPDCFVSDQPYKLSTKLVNGKQYSIYAVIAGFHEKSQAFYLFEEPVSFDECGYFEKTPIYSAVPEFNLSEKGVSEVEVQGISGFDFNYNDNTAVMLEKIKVRWLPEVTQ